MTDEQAAAERLRKLQSSELFAVDYDNDKRAVATRGIGVTWNIWRECKTVIRAYLAEHPADDAVALDEAWLEACGWKAVGNTYYRNYPEPLEGDPIIMWIAVDGSIRIAGLGQWKIARATRGQLRLLCRALGIPLPPENAP